MYIFDSAKREKVKFIPIKDKEVKIYVCGPTVYDDAHLGHARSSVVFDLLNRTLRALGYDVVFVRNYTDIDDKIIKKMKESNKSLKEITSYYIKKYEEEMSTLNVLDPDIKPKATETIEEIISMIESIINHGCAYKIENDGIYFDTSKDPLYLSLSHKKIDDAQSRIEENPNKKDPKDFALWKFSKEGEPKFKSPFGEGRPGWHIECSAMIKKHLSYEGEYQIDIHGGGADLLFPHHENEAAQTRCASSQKLAKYWMHNGFVKIAGEKMSKSLGNSFFLKDALKVYDGEILRYYLLSTHYRQNLNFNEEDLINSKKRLDKLYRLKKRVYKVKESKENQEFKNALLEALKDDLNISKALAVLDEEINKANEKLDKEPKNKAFKSQTAANLKFIEKTLGIGYKDAYEYFQMGVKEEEKREIENLIQQRSEAKKMKDFQKADQIREILLGRGIKIMDTPNGTLWEKEL